jgi:pimeloyl-ACP methyl ester carboxylesterase
MDAAGADAFDEIALWASPLSGAAYVREVRKFARLQAWQKSGEPAAAEALPEGWIESSGFLLSDETLAALEGLDPQQRAGGRLRRALLLGRNGVEADARLQDRLREAGVEVEAGEGRGRGWGAMVSHPERSRLPVRAAEEIETWLAAGPEDAGAGAQPEDDATASTPETTELQLEIDGNAVVETPIAIPSPEGEAFAIVAEPAGQPAAQLCAVFFNAGGVRNAGPNRMWTERARAWAARGVNSVRVDLAGLGEGGGDPDGVPPGGAFFDPRFERQAAAVIEALAQRGLGDRFLLVGLCSGGYFAFRTALADPRVEAAVLVNPWTMVWYPELEDEREARKASRVVQAKWISKLLKGEVAWAKVQKLIRSTLVGLGRKVRDLGRSRRARRGRRAELEAGLDGLRDSSTRLLLAFSDGEPFWEELEDLDFAAGLGRWPNIELVELPGGDHTLRPLGAQLALRAILDAELESALGAPEAAQDRF